MHRAGPGPEHVITTFTVTLFLKIRILTQFPNNQIQLQEGRKLRIKPAQLLIFLRLWGAVC